MEPRSRQGPRTPLALQEGLLVYSAAEVFLERAPFLTCRQPPSRHALHGLSCVHTDRHTDTQTERETNLVSLPTGAPRL